MPGWHIGVIGGSGLYALDGLEEAQRIAVGSAFGEPSTPVHAGRIGGVRFVFLPRHGDGHRSRRAEVNFRANIDALKRAGVHRSPRDLGGRLAARGAGARQLRRRRPVHRPHIGRERSFFGARPRRPCLDGRPGLPAPLGARRRCGRGGGRRGAPRRHLRRHRGPAILDPGRKPALPRVGRAT